MSTGKRIRCSVTLGLGVLALGLLTACTAPTTPQPSPSGQQPSSSAPSPTEVVAKPKRGGTFSFAGGDTPTGPDVHRATSIGTLESFGNVHGTILELSPEDRTTIRGDLAESWVVSQDGKTYTFKIRKGIKTHKGKDFNGEDIAYNLNRMVKRPNNLPVPRLGCIRAAVQEATTPDPYTVVVQLKAPVASFVACLTNPYVMMQPKYLLESVDKENRKMLPEEIDGVGPFQLEEWVSGSIFKTKRFAGFYKEGLPYLDFIQGVTLPDAATQVAAFRTQRIDQFGAFATTPSPSEAAALKQEFGDKITVKEVEAPGFKGFMVNFKKPPLDDVRVREAIDLAANRQNQKDLEFEGKANLSGPYFGGWDWLYSFEEMSKWPGYRADKTQDLARAKQLLKDAGFENGLTLNAILCGTTDNDNCTVLAEDLKKIGVEAKVVRGEAAAQQDRGRRGDFDLYSDSKGAEYDDPDVFNDLFYLPTSGLNWIGWEDPEFIRLNEQQRVELDQKKRGEILRKMADIIRASHVFIFVNRPQLHQTWWSYVKGYVPPKSFYQTSMRRDTVWLDK